ncbi:SusC/RagA family TonB-linked outer membrane protein, partial [Chitinophaga sp.]|uniref:SusC/RagA family TonB-linked outer membrane protein n=1 Tax=Chitinophaga sp. TaxID=1869181 RepID=UPI002BE41B8B
MKITVILLLAFFLQLSAKVSSQRITFTGKNVPLRQLFAEIKKQSGFVVMYNRHLLENEPSANISAINMPLPQFMEKILEGKPLRYRISVQTIFLSARPAVSAQPEQEQRIKVTGTIAGSENQPLPGASVRLKNSGMGTSSNSLGQFVLEDVAEEAVLQISSIGFSTIEVSIDRLLKGNKLDGAKLLSRDANTIHLAVTLSAYVDSLDAVVINNYSTGYQTLSKERATGAFSTITTEALKQQRLSNLGTLLEGRVAGYNNGLIRGTTSMNGVTAPLYVIDGLPVENSTISTTGDIRESVPGLNLEDIEKITVLKDAAAASIYGARAANGVVVIVTKKARKGHPQVNGNATVTFQPYRYYTGRLADASDMIELEKEWAGANPGLHGPDAKSYAQSLLDNKAYVSQGTTALLNYYAGNITAPELDGKLNQLAGSGYRYFNEMAKYAKRNPFLQQYNVNIASATEKNAFYASVTYRNNALEDKFTSNRNIGVNIRNTATLTPWLDLELGTYLQYDEGKEQTFSTLSPGYEYMPYDGLVNTNGTHFTSTGKSRLSNNTMSIIDQYGLYNMDITPLDETGMNLAGNKAFLNRSVGKLNIRFAPWLNYQASFQYETGNERSDLLYDKNSFYVRNKVNSLAGYTAERGFFYLLPYGNIFNRNENHNNAYTFRQQLNFDKTSGKHNITAIAGTETRNNKLELHNQTQYNYDPDVLSFDLLNEQDLANGAGLFFNGTFSGSDVGFDKELINRFVSIYSNAGYAYDDKYLLTGSLRWDRSNLWGTNARYQRKPMWSVGLGWNVFREGFFIPGFVSFLKLRGSYGVVGNIAKDAAPYMTASYSPNYQLGGMQGVIASRPNPLLSWERTFTGNIGMDITMYNNRITAAVDYYRKNGKDLLANTMGVPTEGFGYSTYQINNGEMTNHGIETTISADIISSKKWKWNLTTLFAYNKNKVTYVNIEAPFYILQLDYPLAYPRVGNPYNAIYSYKWAGLSKDGLPQVYDEKNTASTIIPTTLEAIQYSGTTVPVYSGSFSSNLTYKGITFAFLLTYEGGHKIRNTDLPMLNNSYNNNMFTYMTQFGAVNKRITERWRKPGDETKTNVPKALFGEDPDFNSDVFT